MYDGRGDDLGHCTDGAGRQHEIRTFSFLTFMNEKHLIDNFPFRMMVKTKVDEK